MDIKRLPIIFTVLLIMLSSLVAILLASTTSLYAAGIQELDEREYNLDIQSIALLHIKSQNEFLYYLNDKLYKHLALNNNNPDYTFTSLAEAPTNFPMIIYIENHEVLESLSPADKQALKDFYDSSYFMGVGSQGGKFKSLLEVTLGSDFETVGEEYHSDIFFIHKGDSGVVNELLLSGLSSAGDIMRHLMLWYHSLYGAESISSIEAGPSGAWDASYTIDYRKQLIGGTSRFLVNGFKLKSPADKPDYYLLTTSIQTDITNHKCDSLKGSCGWFSNEMYLSAQVDTSNGGKLYANMPTGSVGNSSTGFSIGGSLTTTQIGLTGGIRSLIQFQMQLI